MVNGVIGVVLHPIRLVSLYVRRLGHTQRENHVKDTGQDGHLQTRERSLRRNHPAWHLDLRFPATSA